MSHPPNGGSSPGKKSHASTRTLQSSSTPMDTLQTSDNDIAFPNASTESAEKSSQFHNLRRSPRVRRETSDSQQYSVPSSYNGRALPPSARALVLPTNPQGNVGLTSSGQNAPVLPDPSSHQSSSGFSQQLFNANASTSGSSGANASSSFHPTSSIRPPHSLRTLSRPKSPGSTTASHYASSNFAPSLHSTSISPYTHSHYTAHSYTDSHPLPRSPASTHPPSSSYLSSAHTSLPLLPALPPLPALAQHATSTTASTTHPHTRSYPDQYSHLHTEGVPPVTYSPPLPSSQHHLSYGPQHPYSHSHLLSHEHQQHQQQQPPLPLDLSLFPQVSPLVPISPPQQSTHTTHNPQHTHHTRHTRFDTRTTRIVHPAEAAFLTIAPTYDPSRVHAQQAPEASQPQQPLLTQPYSHTPRIEEPAELFITSTRRKTQISFGAERVPVSRNPRFDATSHMAFRGDTCTPLQQLPLHSEALHRDSAWSPDTGENISDTFAAYSDYSTGYNSHDPANEPRRAEVGSGSPAGAMRTVGLMAGRAARPMRVHRYVQSLLARDGEDEVDEDGVYEEELGAEEVGKEDGRRERARAEKRRRGRAEMKEGHEDMGDDGDGEYNGDNSCDNDEGDGDDDKINKKAWGLSEAFSHRAGVHPSSKPLLFSLNDDDSDDDSPYELSSSSDESEEVALEAEEPDVASLMAESMLSEGQAGGGLAVERVLGESHMADGLVLERQMRPDAVGRRLVGEDASRRGGVMTADAVRHAMDEDVVNVERSTKVSLTGVDAGGSNAGAALRDEDEEEEWGGSEGMDKESTRDGLEEGSADQDEEHAAADDAVAEMADGRRLDAAASNATTIATDFAAATADGVMATRARDHGAGAMAEDARTDAGEEEDYITVEEEDAGEEGGAYGEDDEEDEDDVYREEEDEAINGQGQGGEEGVVDEGRGDHGVAVNPARVPGVYSGVYGGDSDASESDIDIEATDGEEDEDEEDGYEEDDDVLGDEDEDGEVERVDACDEDEDEDEGESEDEGEDRGVEEEYSEGKGEDNDDIHIRDVVKGRVSAHIDDDNFDEEDDDYDENMADDDNYDELAAWEDDSDSGSDTASIATTYANEEYPQDVAYEDATDGDASYEDAVYQDAGYHSDHYDAGYDAAYTTEDHIDAIYTDDAVYHQEIAGDDTDTGYGTDAGYERFSGCRAEMETTYHGVAGNTNNDMVTGATSGSGNAANSGDTDCGISGSASAGEAMEQSISRSIRSPESAISGKTSFSRRSAFTSVPPVFPSSHAFTPYSAHTSLARTHSLSSRTPHTHTPLPRAHSPVISSSASTQRTSSHAPSRIPASVSTHDGMPPPPVPTPSRARTPLGHTHPHPHVPARSHPHLDANAHPHVHVQGQGQAHAWSHVPSPLPSSAFVTPAATRRAHPHAHPHTLAHVSHSHTLARAPPLLNTPTDSGAEVDTGISTSMTSGKTTGTNTGPGMGVARHDGLEGNMSRIPPHPSPPITIVHSRSSSVYSARTTQHPVAREAVYGQETVHGRDTAYASGAENRGDAPYTPLHPQLTQQHHAARHSSHYSVHQPRELSGNGDRGGRASMDTMVTTQASLHLDSLHTLPVPHPTNSTSYSPHTSTSAGYTSHGTAGDAYVSHSAASGTCPPHSGSVPYDAPQGRGTGPVSEASFPGSIGAPPSHASGAAASTSMRESLRSAPLSAANSLSSAAMLDVSADASMHSTEAFSTYSSYVPAESAVAGDVDAGETGDNIDVSGLLQALIRNAATEEEDEEWALMSEDSGDEFALSEEEGSEAGSGSEGDREEEDGEEEEVPVFRGAHARIVEKENARGLERQREMDHEKEKKREGDAVHGDVVGSVATPGGTRADWLAISPLPAMNTNAPPVTAPSAKTAPPRTGPVPSSPAASATSAHSWRSIPSVVSTRSSGHVYTGDADGGGARSMSSPVVSTVVVAAASVESVAGTYARAATIKAAAPSSLSIISTTPALSPSASMASSFSTLSAPSRSTRRTHTRADGSSTPRSNLPATTKSMGDIANDAKKIVAVPTTSGPSHRHPRGPMVSPEAAGATTTMDKNASGNAGTAGALLSTDAIPTTRASTRPLRRSAAAVLLAAAAVDNDATSALDRPPVIATTTVTTTDGDSGTVAGEQGRCGPAKISVVAATATSAQESGLETASFRRPGPLRVTMKTSTLGDDGDDDEIFTPPEDDDAEMAAETLDPHVVESAKTRIRATLRRERREQMKETAEDYAKGRAGAWRGPPGEISSGKAGDAPISTAISKKATGSSNEGKKSRADASSTAAKPRRVDMAHTHAVSTASETVLAAATVTAATADPSYVNSQVRSGDAQVSTDSLNRHSDASVTPVGTATHTPLAAPLSPVAAKGKGKKNKASKPAPSPRITRSREDAVTRRGGICKESTDSISASMGVAGMAQADVSTAAEPMTTLESTVAAPGDTLSASLATAIATVDTRAVTTSAANTDAIVSTTVITPTVIARSTPACTRARRIIAPQRVDITDYVAPSPAFSTAAINANAGTPQSLFPAQIASSHRSDSQVTDSTMTTPDMPHLTSVRDTVRKRQGSARVSASTATRRAVVKAQAVAPSDLAVSPVTNAEVHASTATITAGIDATAVDTAAYTIADTAAISPASTALITCRPPQSSLSEGSSLTTTPSDLTPTPRTIGVDEAPQKPQHQDRLPPQAIRDGIRDGNAANLWDAAGAETVWEEEDTPVATNGASTAEVGSHTHPSEDKGVASAISPATELASRPLQPTGTAISPCLGPVSVLTATSSAAAPSTLPARIPVPAARWHTILANPAQPISERRGAAAALLSRLLTHMSPHTILARALVPLTTTPESVRVMFSAVLRTIAGIYQPLSTHALLYWRAYDELGLHSIPNVYQGVRHEGVDTQGRMFMIPLLAHSDIIRGTQSADEIVAVREFQNQTMEIAEVAASADSIIANSTMIASLAVDTPSPRVHRRAGVPAAPRHPIVSTNRAHRDEVPLEDTSALSPLLAHPPVRLHPSEWALAATVISNLLMTPTPAFPLLDRALTQQYLASLPALPVYNTLLQRISEREQHWRSARGILEEEHEYQVLTVQPHLASVNAGYRGDYATQSTAEARRAASARRMVPVGGARQCLGGGITSVTCAIPPRPDPHHISTSTLISLFDILASSSSLTNTALALSSLLSLLPLAPTNLFKHLGISTVLLPNPESSFPTFALTATSTVGTGLGAAPVEVSEVVLALTAEAYHARVMTTFKAAMSTLFLSSSISCVPIASNCRLSRPLPLYPQLLPPVPCTSPLSRRIYRPPQPLPHTLALHTPSPAAVVAAEDVHEEVKATDLLFARARAALQRDWGSVRGRVEALRRVLEEGGGCVDDCRPIGDDAGAGGASGNKDGKGMSARSSEDVAVSDSSRSDSNGTDMDLQQRNPQEVRNHALELSSPRGSSATSHTHSSAASTSTSTASSSPSAPPLARPLPSSLLVDIERSRRRTRYKLARNTLIPIHKALAQPTGVPSRALPAAQLWTDKQCRRLSTQWSCLAQLWCQTQWLCVNAPVVTQKRFTKDVNRESFLKPVPGFRIPDSQTKTLNAKPACGDSCGSLTRTCEPSSVFDSVQALSVGRTRLAATDAVVEVWSSPIEERSPLLVLTRPLPLPRHALGEQLGLSSDSTLHSSAVCSSMHAYTTDVNEDAKDNAAASGGNGEDGALAAPIDTGIANASACSPLDTGSVSLADSHSSSDIISGSGVSLCAALQLSLGIAGVCATVLPVHEYHRLLDRYCALRASNNSKSSMVTRGTGSGCVMACSSDSGDTRRRRGSLQHGCSQSSTDPVGDLADSATAVNAGLRAAADVAAEVDSNHPSRSALQGSMQQEISKEVSGGETSLLSGYLSSFFAAQAIATTSTTLGKTGKRESTAPTRQSRASSSLSNTTESGRSLSTNSISGLGVSAFSIAATCSTTPTAPTGVTLHTSASSPSRAELYVESLHALCRLANHHAICDAAETDTNASSSSRTHNDAMATETATSGAGGSGCVPGGVSGAGGDRISPLQSVMVTHPQSSLSAALFVHARRDGVPIRGALQEMVVLIHGHYNATALQAGEKNADKTKRGEKKGTKKRSEEFQFPRRHEDIDILRVSSRDISQFMSSIRSVSIIPSGIALSLCKRILHAIDPISLNLVAFPVMALPHSCPALYPYNADPSSPDLSSILSLIPPTLLSPLSLHPLSLYAIAQHNGHTVLLLPPPRSVNDMVDAHVSRPEMEHDSIAATSPSSSSSASSYSAASPLSPSATTFSPASSQPWWTGKCTVIPLFPHLSLFDAIALSSISTKTTELNAMISPLYTKLGTWCNLSVSACFPSPLSSQHTPHNPPTAADMTREAVNIASGHDATTTTSSPDTHAFVPTLAQTTSSVSNIHRNIHSVPPHFPLLPCFPYLTPSATQIHTYFLSDRDYFPERCFSPLSTVLLRPELFPPRESDAKVTTTSTTTKTSIAAAAAGRAATDSGVVSQAEEPTGPVSGAATVATASVPLPADFDPIRNYLYRRRTHHTAGPIPTAAPTPAEMMSRLLPQHASRTAYNEAMLHQPSRGCVRAVLDTCHDVWVDGHSLCLQLSEDTRVDGVMKRSRTTAYAQGVSPVLRDESNPSPLNEAQHRLPHHTHAHTQAQTQSPRSLSQSQSPALATPAYLSSFAPCPASITALATPAHPHSDAFYDANPSFAPLAAWRHSADALVCYSGLCDGVCTCRLRPMHLYAEVEETGVGNGVKVMDGTEKTRIFDSMSGVSFSSHRLNERASAEAAANSRTSTAIKHSRGVHSRSHTSQLVHPTFALTASFAPSLSQPCPPPLLRLPSLSSSPIVPLLSMSLALPISHTLVPSPFPYDHPHSTTAALDALAVAPPCVPPVSFLTLSSALSLPALIATSLAAYITSVYSHALVHPHLLLPLPPVHALAHVDPSLPSLAVLHHHLTAMDDTPLPPTTASAPPSASDAVAHTRSSMWPTLPSNIIDAASPCTAPPASSSRAEARLALRACSAYGLAMRTASLRYSLQLVSTGPAFRYFYSAASAISRARAPLTPRLFSYSEYSYRDWSQDTLTEDCLIHAPNTPTSSCPSSSSSSGQPSLISPAAALLALLTRPLELPLPYVHTSLLTLLAATDVRVPVAVELMHSLCADEAAYSDYEVLLVRARRAEAPDNAVRAATGADARGGVGNQGDTVRTEVKNADSKTITTHKAPLGVDKTANKNSTQASPLALTSLSLVHPRYIPHLTEDVLFMHSDTCAHPLPLGEALASELPVLVAMVRRVPYVHTKRLVSPDIARIGAGVEVEEYLGKSWISGHFPNPELAYSRIPTLQRCVLISDPAYIYSHLISQSTSSFCLLSCTSIPLASLARIGASSGILRAPYAASLPIQDEDVTAAFRHVSLNVLLMLEGSPVLAAHVPAALAFFGKYGSGFWIIMEKFFPRPFSLAHVTTPGNHTDDLDATSDRDAEHEEIPDSDTNPVSTKSPLISTVERSATSAATTQTVAIPLSTHAHPSPVHVTLKAWLRSLLFPRTHIDKHPDRREEAYTMMPGSMEVLDSGATTMLANVGVQHVGVADFAVHARDTDIPLAMVKAAREEVTVGMRAAELVMPRDDMGVATHGGAGTGVGVSGSVTTRKRRRDLRKPNGSDIVSRRAQTPAQPLRLREHALYPSNDVLAPTSSTNTPTNDIGVSVDAPRAARGEGVDVIRGLVRNAAKSRRREKVLHATGAVSEGEEMTGDSECDVLEDSFDEPDAHAHAMHMRSTITHSNARLSRLVMLRSPLARVNHASVPESNTVMPTSPPILPLIRRHAPADVVHVNAAMATSAGFPQVPEDGDDSVSDVNEEEHNAWVGDDVADREIWPSGPFTHAEEVDTLATDLRRALFRKIAENNRKIELIPVQHAYRPATMYSDGMYRSTGVANPFVVQSVRREGYDDLPLSSPHRIAEDLRSPLLFRSKAPEHPSRTTTELKQSLDRRRDLLNPKCSAGTFAFLYRDTQAYDDLNLQNIIDPEQRVTRSKAAQKVDLHGSGSNFTDLRRELNLDALRNRYNLPILMPPMPMPDNLYVQYERFAYKSDVRRDVE